MSRDYADLSRALLSRKKNQSEGHLDIRDAVVTLSIESRPPFYTIAALVKSAVSHPDRKVRQDAFDAFLRVSERPENRTSPKNRQKRDFNLRNIEIVVAIILLFDSDDLIQRDAMSVLYNQPDNALKAELLELIEPRSDWMSNAVAKMRAELEGE